MSTSSIYYNHLVANRDKEMEFYKNAIAKYMAEGNQVMLEIRQKDMAGREWFYNELIEGAIKNMKN